MTKMVYVVYTTGEEDPRATCDNRSVAYSIAEYLETETGLLHWVIDLPVSHSLEEYKGVTK